ncbi:MAG: hypothetical protein RIG61_07210 [Deltaproteobacteria bacterium]
MEKPFLHNEQDYTGRQGRALFPLKPENVQSQLSHEEIRSIFLYLQAIGPVKNKVPAPIYPDDELFQE